MVALNTDPQRKQFIQSLSEKERKGVIFIQESKKPRVEGVRIVDPRTGALGQSIFKRDLPGRKFKTIPATAQIQASQRRLEEKIGQRELAQKEAEFEAKRIREGKIKAKDVVLTRRGARERLQTILKEEARKKAAKPTPVQRETFQRELFRKQRILTTLEKQEAARVEEERIKQPLEIFSEEAQQQLGLGETKEGLLTITDAERKKVIGKVTKEEELARDFFQLVESPFEIPKRVTRVGEVLADIPVSAEFDTKFLGQIGTGDIQSDFEKALRVGGIFSFGGRIVTGKQLLGEPKKALDFLETKVSPLTTRLFQTKTLKQEQKRLRTEINKLEGKVDRSSVIQRRLLKGDLAAVSVEIGTRKQIGEQPIQTALFFGGGALVTKGIAGLGLIGKPITKIASGVLGTLFVGGTALEIKTQTEIGGIEAGAEVFGERLAEATAFIGGGAFASRFLIQPKRVKVLKAKGLKAEFAETLETKGTSAKNLQRLGLTTETKVKVAKTDVRAFARQIKVKKPESIAKLLSRKDIRFEFRFDSTTGQPRQVLVQDVSAAVRRFNVKPTPFEIQIVKGKLGIRAVTERGVIQGVKDIKDISGLDLKRIIDPTVFKRISGKKGLTILQKEFVFDIDKLPFSFRAELGGEALITGKVKPVKRIADIFGIGLFQPELITTTFKPVTTRLSFRPILATAPIFEPSPLLVFPTNLLDLFGRKERRAREPTLNIRRDLSRLSGITPDTISESLSKKDILSDLLQVAEQRREGRRIQEPILDFELGEAQLPIVDVFPVSKREPILDVGGISDFITITKQVTKPKEEEIPTPLLRFRRRKKRKVKQKGVFFDGFFASAKQKGKFIPLNKKPLTENAALSRGAEVVDKSLSSQFKVKRRTVKVEPKSTGNRYFGLNRNKFRNFRISKGKKKPLPRGQFIEKRGKRLDTKSEVNKIQVKAALARIRKREFGLSKPKRSRGFF